MNLRRAEARSTLIDPSAGDRATARDTQSGAPVRPISLRRDGRIGPAPVAPVAEAEADLVPRLPETAAWQTDAPDRARLCDARSRSALSPLLRRLYRVRRMRGLTRRLCERLEGGGMYSANWRELLLERHGVEIGRYSYGAILEPGVLPPGTVVGDYCSVGAQLVVRRRDHPTDRPVLHPFFYNRRLGFLSRDTIPQDADNPLTVGHDVWIGDRVTILSGCKSIGNGAVIAAGTVVTKDVAPYTIVAGVPARPLRQRLDDETIARLESSRWWAHPLSTLIERPPVSGLLG